METKKPIDTRSCLLLKYDVDPNLWICQECGEEMPQPAKMRLNTAVQMMKAFVAAHKNCDKKWREKWANTSSK